MKHVVPTYEQDCVQCGHYISYRHDPDGNVAEDHIAIRCAECGKINDKVPVTT